MRESKRIEAEMLIVGYAMSRLGRRYLQAFHYRTWQDAYMEASSILGAPPASFKNLRDEFDPFLSTERRGLLGRDIRPNWQAVIGDLAIVCDPGLLELVRRSIAADTQSMDEVIDLVLEPPKRIYNVAERLLTGRLAEDYFLSNSQSILNIDRDGLSDCRQLACGFDFGASQTLSWQSR